MVEKYASHLNNKCFTNKPKMPAAAATDRNLLLFYVVVSYLNAPCFFIFKMTGSISAFIVFIENVQ
jgi:hypothetical protein